MSHPFDMISVNLRKNQGNPEIRRMVFPQHRSKLYGRPVQDMLPAHHWSFSDKWQQRAEKAATHSREKAETFYNAHARNLPEIRIGSHVAVQDSETKVWDIYGIVTDFGPHRRYYIKTQSAWSCSGAKPSLNPSCGVPASISNTQNQQPAQSQPVFVQRRLLSPM